MRQLNVFTGLLGLTLLLASCGQLRQGASSGGPSPVPPPPPPPPTTGSLSVVPPQDYAVKVPFGSVPTDAHLKGQWSQVVPWTVNAMHAILLPDGKVVSFGGNYYPDYRQYAGKTTVQYPNAIDLWDPISGSHTDISYVGSSVFCAGHVVLPDGRLMLNGGDDITGLFDPYSQGKGIRDNVVYDYASKKWTRVADMQGRRWYPNTTVLPSGEVLSMSGTKEYGEDLNTLPEVYNPRTNTWRSLPGASSILEAYPRMFVLSDGLVIGVGGGMFPMNGSAVTTGIYDTAGSGRYLRFNRGDGIKRDYGTAAMFAKDKILVVGGGGDANATSNPEKLPPTNSAVVVQYDPATKQARTTPTAPMQYPRRHAVATLLPDETVLVTGGTQDYGFNIHATAPKAAEVWNPTTGQWRTLAAMQEIRGYHSSALLLPDGTVLVSGGAGCRPKGGTADPATDPSCPSTYDPNDPTSARSWVGYGRWMNSQVFMPPYLFEKDASGVTRRARRPTIQGVPSDVRYGATFTVRTPDAAKISRVVLVKLGSETHGFNMSQEIARLQITARGADTLTVKAPTSPNLATPGHYMLFVLDGRGVPSVSRILDLDLPDENDG